MKSDTRQRLYIMRRAFYTILQNGRCPCGGDLAGPLELDHDHACCAVDRADRACGLCDRAIMHAGCNAAISRVRDNPKRLRGLADYLERAS
jgi:Recombination endonuclease VII